MDNILKEIAEKRLVDVEEMKREYDYPFYQALRKHQPIQYHTRNSYCTALYFQVLFQHPC